MPSGAFSRHSLPGENLPASTSKAEPALTSAVAAVEAPAEATAEAASSPCAPGETVAKASPEAPETKADNKRSEAITTGGEAPPPTEADSKEEAALEEKEQDEVEVLPPQSPVSAVIGEVASQGPPAKERAGVCHHIDVPLKQPDCPTHPSASSAPIVQPAPPPLPASPADPHASPPSVVPRNVGTEHSPTESAAAAGEEEADVEAGARDGAGAGAGASPSAQLAELAHGAEAGTGFAELPVRRDSEGEQEGEEGEQRATSGGTLPPEPQRQPESESEAGRLQASSGSENAQCKELADERKSLGISGQLGRFVALPRDSAPELPLEPMAQGPDATFEFQRKVSEDRGFSETTRTDDLEMQKQRLRDLLESGKFDSVLDELSQEAPTMPLTGPAGFSKKDGAGSALAAAIAAATATATSANAPPKEPSFATQMQEELGRVEGRNLRTGEAHHEGSVLSLLIQQFAVGAATGQGTAPAVGLPLPNDNDNNNNNNNNIDNHNHNTTTTSRESAKDEGEPEASVEDCAALGRYVDSRETTRDGSPSGGPKPSPPPPQHQQQQQQRPDPPSALDLGGTLGASEHMGEQIEGAKHRVRRMLEDSVIYGKLDAVLCNVQTGGDSGSGGMALPAWTGTAPGFDHPQPPLALPSWAQVRMEAPTAPAAPDPFAIPAPTAFSSGAAYPATMLQQQQQQQQQFQVQAQQQNQANMIEVPYFQQNNNNNNSNNMMSGLCVNNGNTIQIIPRDSQQWCVSMDNRSGAWVPVVEDPNRGTSPNSWVGRPTGGVAEESAIRSNASSDGTDQWIAPALDDHGRSAWAGSVQQQPIEQDKYFVPDRSGRMMPHTGVQC